jgi:hypothetical protein
MSRSTLGRNDGAHLEEETQAQANRLCELAERDLTIAPRASLHGWLALPWLDGKRLHCTEMNAAMFTKVVSYIQAAAGPTLSTSEREVAFSRPSIVATQ